MQALLDRLWHLLQAYIGERVQANTDECCDFLPEDRLIDMHVSLNPGINYCPYSVVARCSLMWE